MHGVVGCHAAAHHHRVEAACVHNAVVKQSESIKFRHCLILTELAKDLL